MPRVSTLDIAQNEARIETRLGKRVPLRTSSGRPEILARVQG